MKSTFVAIMLFTSLFTYNYGSTAHAAQTMKPSHHEDFSVWCERSLRTLERSRMEASRSAIRGDFVGSTQKLLEGLRLDTYAYETVSPITLNLISYAHSVGERLSSTMGENIRLQKITTITLESFYDLIFRAADRIDARYYSCRYNRGRRDCYYSRSREFERNVLEAVKDMLYLLNTNLVASRGRQIFPLGSSSSYLNVAELVSGYASRELQTLVYAQGYSCEILDLEHVYSDLREFNQSSHSEYVKKEKVIQTYYDLNHVIDRINSGYSCY
jgi:hypothetical protein